MAVDYTTHDGVAVLTLNNPPVNGLGLSTRAGIVEGLERAQNDPAVKAIVLTGAGKAFSGGADITEFNAPKATQEPTLHTVIKAVEGIARQPEAGGRIAVNMIIAAALIEGFTFFALVVCMGLIGKIMPS